MSNVGHFVWYDLSTSDTNAAKAFYTETIGWKTESSPNPTYTMFRTEQGHTGGVIAIDADKAGKIPPHWAGYVEVPDVDKMVARFKEKGGNVVVPACDIPNVGRFAYVTDPQGAVIALFTSKTQHPLPNPQKSGQFAWHELYTSDLEKGFAFYAEMFGWQKIEEMDMGPMGKYVLFGKDGEHFGGMMKAPPGFPVPAVWGYYITMADFDAALERIKAKGGKVMNGPMDVPGGQRVANCMDPQGAMFSITTPRP